MKNTQSKIIIKKIISNIETLDIAGYLIQETKYFLRYVNYYKLKNIIKNIDSLSDYLYFIDQHNTSQINEIDNQFNENQNKSDYDNLYYVSKKGLEFIGEENLIKKICQNNFNISYVMQGVKGFLLLTVSEFCNASPTRMSINKMLWQKQKNKNLN